MKLLEFSRAVSVVTPMLFAFTPDCSSANIVSVRVCPQAHAVAFEAHADSYSHHTDYLTIEALQNQTEARSMDISAPPHTLIV